VLTGRWVVKITRRFWASVTTIRRRSRSLQRLSRLPARDFIQSQITYTSQSRRIFIYLYIYDYQNKYLSLL